MFNPLRSAGGEDSTARLRVLADEELMQLVYRGNAAAFEVIYDRHADAAFSLAYRMCAQRALAEDVVQEAFLKTFTGWGRLRDRGRADAYLRRSVVNLSRSRLRRRTVEGRGNAAVHRDDRVDCPPSGHDIDLLEAVRALPPRQRATVALFYYADLPESEVARTLGCSVGTVKSQLAKARAALARGLGADPEGSLS